MSQAQIAIKTSFTRMFGHPLPNLPVFGRIEIPLIQRDYAQGREGEVVTRIRSCFLDALHNAVKPGGLPIDLDFVYGDVEKGAFYPLDGQQRLTTLYLFHWYLAWRACVPIQDQSWTKFTYATRPSAERFCQQLATYQPPANQLQVDERLSFWVKDQHWYLYPWEHDPTIQSMMVVIDELHERFRFCNEQDCKAMWCRLADEQQPGISFHLLPIESTGLTNELYIKMNSRGRPLTTFENFKAYLEEVLGAERGEVNAKHFAHKVDTDWSDMLWPYRSKDNSIDDAFMRYFRFVTEVCAWLTGVPFNEETHADDLAKRVYGNANARGAESFEFLCKAFDTWHKKNISGEWEGILTQRSDAPSTKLRLFDAFEKEPCAVDLFGACCRLYRETGWNLSHTLLLYAALLNRIDNTADFPMQLRILRNLIEASRGGEIREQNMPELLSDVRRLVIGGSLQELRAFNQGQVANEKEKSVLLHQQPALEAAVFRLEDHDLLRGCLASFDLNPSIGTSIFLKRADAFHALFNNDACWKQLTGALLAIGNYSRQKERLTGFRLYHFGSPGSKTPWRDLFKGSREPRLVATLAKLLDQVAADHSDLDSLTRIQKEYLDECANVRRGMDWRYYVVKYPAMREGTSGRYVVSSSGYNMCMLNNESMRGHYRDPYLMAILIESGVGDAVSDPWFGGYETQPRQIVLKRSGIHLQCVDQGWQILGRPNDPAHKRAFDRVCAERGIGEDGLYVVPQTGAVDTEDRVVLGAAVLKDFVHAGL